MDVRAAADLEAEGVAVGDLDEAHALAVAVAEERERAALYGGRIGVFVAVDAGVLSYFLVDEVLHLP